MSLGSLVFGQPLALLGLVAVPLIWWLLRATPPEPKRFALPSLALLEGLSHREETPAQTPWWIILLRCLVAVLAIFGFSQPSWNSISKIENTQGTVLIVMDDGWTSAQRWQDMKRSAIAATDEAASIGQASYLLFTAPQLLATDPAEALTADAARRRIQSINVSSWSPDRSSALERLQTAKLKPARILWISDGLDHGSSQAFATALSDIAPLFIQNFSPAGPYAITHASVSPQGAQINVVRANATEPVSTRVIAEGVSGASLASAEVNFKENEFEAQAEFVMPASALNQTARFRIITGQSSGAVWLWDDASLSPTVGLADPPQTPQPLLNEFYYVRKSLEGYAQMSSGPLADMIAASPDAIILGDRHLSQSIETDGVLDWIEAGGALIRFAGPKLAEESDEFTPVPLRRAARALGGALAWENPQPIASFSRESAFNGIPAPGDDVLVRQQVLAQPDPGLASLTWARLDDGTPLVTARRIGRGIIILFHVTATPEWSDLPYTQAFVEMLKRATASGDGGANRNINADGVLTPVRVLDGYGTLQQPPDTAQSIPGDGFLNAKPGPRTPPGLYVGPQGSRALNAASTAPTPINTWPAQATLLEAGDIEQRHGLRAWFYSMALILVFIDILVSLVVSGRLLGQAATKALLVFAALHIIVLDSSEASAQSQQNISQKEREAALSLRFAYIETNDAGLNEQLRAGLEGLRLELYKRTSVEPDSPHSVRPGIDTLSLYPMIYYAPPRNADPFSPEEVTALNQYMRSGGALVIDTRDYTPGLRPDDRLKTLLQGLDAPPLRPAPDDHVLTRSFYLLDSFPGRLESGPLWIESDAVHDETQRGDGVSGLFIGSSDWIGAWALDDRTQRPINDMNGRERRRELAYRFGVNLVMYILTGNYKADQVHIPALLDRLDEEQIDRLDDGPGRVRETFPSRPSSSEPEDLQKFFEDMRERRNNDSDATP